MATDDAPPAQPEASATGSPSGQPGASPAPQGRVKGRGRRRGQSPNMLPGRPSRTLGLERLLVRVVATCGIVGIGVVLGAILKASNVAGWIIGLAVSLLSVVLAATLWSSRQM